MPVFRYLIFALAVWLAIQIIRRMLRHRRPPAETRISQDFIETVACQHCGVRIPRNDASRRDKRFYCCPQHRDAD